MSNEKKEKTRKRRKSSVPKEQNVSKEEEEEEQNNEPGRLTEEEQTISLTPMISEKMTSMDVRIKYGFIKHLHKVLLSVNDRMNWTPDELLSLGLVFRDLSGIEKTVYDTVIKSMEEEDDGEEQTEEVNSEDIN